MKQQDFSDFEEKIERTVENIARSPQFQNLKKEVRGAAKDVQSAVRETVKEVSASFSSNNVQGQQRSQNSRTTYQAARNSSGGWQPGSPPITPRRPGAVYSTPPARRPQKKQNVQAAYSASVSNANALDPRSLPRMVGKTKATLLTMLGTAGMILFALPLFTGLGEAIASGALSPAGITDFEAVRQLMFFFGCFLLSGVIASGGRKINKRLRRFTRYVQELRGRKFCAISQLASAVGKSEGYVARDLAHMIQLRMFPTGYIDPNKTYLILDQTTYQQYLDAEQIMKQQQMAAKAEQKQEPKQEVKQPEQSSAAQTGNAELDRVIAEGNRYIQEIRSANNAIPGEEFSRKISRMEAVTTQIFSYVTNHPNKVSEIRKFLSYYLPTSLKLLHSYQKFDAQPIQTENILAAKQEIQDSFDKINAAFENLLEGLYQEDVLDIYSDISVLENMLAQEGLTDSDFKMPAQTAEGFQQMGG